MDGRAKSLFPFILMLFIMLTMPLTIFPVSHDIDLSSDDISTTTARSQTTWSGVVELTESYTIAVTDELIIAPCTLVDFVEYSNFSQSALL